MASFRRKCLSVNFRVSQIGKTWSQMHPGISWHLWQLQWKHFSVVVVVSSAGHTSGFCTRRCKTKMWHYLYKYVWTSVYGKGVGGLFVCVRFKTEEKYSLIIDDVLCMPSRQKHSQLEWRWSSRRAPKLRTETLFPCMHMYIEEF